MKIRIGRTVQAVLLGGLALVLLGPFLVPVPPLEGTQPPSALADADSRFIEINGLSVHVKTIGQGEPVFLLLHGFGASLYSWQPVMSSFSQLGTVIAFDRPAFGLTERPLTWQGQNPYSPEAQIALVIGLLNHYGIEKAILVGNSAGGTVAMQTWLAKPERVSMLILVDPAVFTGGGTPGWVRPLLSTPQLRHLGPLFARQIQERGPKLIEIAWHDPELIPAETIDLYQKPLQIENWDRALWEFTLASRPSGLAEHLADFTLPVLVITGDDDRIVPTADSVELASKLPNATLAIIANAGHVPHEEKPEEFMQAIISFLSSQHSLEKPDA